MNIKTPVALLMAVLIFFSAVGMTRLEAPTEPPSYSVEPDTTITDLTPPVDPNVKLNELLRENGAYLGADGKLHALNSDYFMPMSLTEIYNEAGVPLPAIMYARSTFTVIAGEPSVPASQIQFADGTSYAAPWNSKSVNGIPAYCLEQKIMLHEGENTGYTQTSPGSDVLNRLTLIDYYGRYLNVGAVDDLGERMFYAQLMVWEYQGSCEVVSMNDTMGIGYNGVNYDSWIRFKNAVTDNINKFYTTPSIANQSVHLKMGESITLTDTTGSFSNYLDTPIFNNTGVQVVKSGNQVTLTATGTPNPSGVISFGYDIAMEYSNQGPSFYYDHVTLQDVGTGGFRDGDPRGINLNVTVETNGSIGITKTSEDGIVNGLQFRVTGTGVDTTVTTGADGRITVPNLAPGTYTVAEVNTPNKYVAPASQSVVVTANTTAQVSFHNVLKRQNLEITKTSEDGIVNGLQFRVTGTGVDTTVTTGADGRITVPNLLPGTYTVTEVNTPSKYVVPASQTVVVTENATAYVSFHNVLARGSLSVNKVSTNGTALSGMVASVYNDVNNNKVYDETIDTFNSNLTETSVGEYFSHNLLLGNYLFIENQSPTGHIKDQSVYPFSVTANGETVVLSNNGTTTFTNDTTKVEISKKDIATSEELPGAKLHIEDLDGNILYEWTSTDKPHYIETIPVGKYKLVEDLAPLGYLVANEVEFTVLATGEVQKVEMKDDFTKVEISKREIGKSEELAGAHLHIEDMDGNILYEWVSSDTPYYIERLPIGRYKLVEDLAPIGYLLAHDIEFEVLAIDNIQSVVMYDEPITNIMRFSKADSYGGGLLANATYGIYTMQDELLQSLTTDETGFAVSEELRYGDYYLREMVAPDRFEIDPTKHMFSVKDIGEENSPVLEMKNDPKIGSMTMSYSEKELPIAPQTGDESHLPLIITLAFSGSMLLGVLIYKKSKNKKRLFSLLAVVFSAVTVLSFNASADVIVDENKAFETTVIETTDKNEMYNFSDNIEHENEQYTLKNVTSKILEETAKSEELHLEHNEEKYTLEQNATFNEEYEKDGYTLTLNDVSYEEVKTAEKTDKLEQSIVINRGSFRGETENTIVTEYFYEEYGVTIEVPLHLDRVEQSNPQWVSDVSVPVTIKGVDTAYISFGDEMIPFDGTEPPLNGYENTFLSFLELDSKYYRLNSIAWSGESYTDENGVLCRNAVISGERYVSTFTAYYGGENVTIPQTDIYKAVAHYGAVQNVLSTTDFTYKIEFTAEYEKGYQQSFLEQYGVYLLIILIVIAVVITLYIIAKKKKENTKNKGVNNYGKLRNNTN